MDLTSSIDDPMEGVIAEKATAVAAVLNRTMSKKLSTLEEVAITTLSSII